jgi:hypothetical protein
MRFSGTGSWIDAFENADLIIPNLKGLSTLFQYFRI